MSAIATRKERNGGEHPLARMRDDFQGMFDRFLGHWQPIFQPEFFWEVESAETDKEIIVRAEAPGFEAEDFDVVVCGNHLKIKADKRFEAGEKKEETVRRERHYERCMTLAAEVDPDRTEAHYRNGVLEVFLTKTKDAQGKHIPVKK